MLVTNARRKTHAQKTQKVPPEQKVQKRSTSKTGGNLNEFTF